MPTKSGLKPVRFGSIVVLGKNGNHMKLIWLFHYLLKRLNGREWQYLNTRAKKTVHFFQDPQTLENSGSERRIEIEKLLGSTTNSDYQNMKQLRVLCSIVR